MKVNEAASSLALPVCLVYGPDIHRSVAVTVFLLNLPEWPECFLGDLPFSIFVTSSLPSPYRELYSVSFMLPLPCDLFYIHIICTVSAFRPNVLSMLYHVYTSNSPRLHRVNSTTFSICSLLPIGS